MTKNSSYTSWQEKELASSLGRFPERYKSFYHHGGAEIPRLSLPTTIDEEYEGKIGFPGRYPFTRGVQPTMYRGRLWTMRQYAGFASASQTNERFRYLLEQGQTGLSVAFDLPTQMGYDSDAPFASGEVGRVGVPISSIEDMQVLLDDLPLGDVTTSMTINSTAPILLLLYQLVAEEQGVDNNMPAINGLTFTMAQYRMFEKFAADDFDSDWPPGRDGKRSIRVIVTGETVRNDRRVASAPNEATATGTS